MTDSDETLAKFAAAFLANFAANDVPPLAVPQSLPDYPGLTVEAANLVRAVDGGGVPAFVTENLRRIAADNGIPTDSRTTPDQIVAALRAQAEAAGKNPETDHG